MARIDRTPSGLPLCSTCHQEFGFCSHTSRGMNMTGTEGSTAVPAAAAGSGATARETVTVPSALSMNAPSQPQRRNPLEDYLQQGKKRRRSAALHEGTLGKGTRRAILAQPTSRDTKGPGGKKDSKKGSNRAKRNLRRSTRFAEGEPAAAKTASFASSCSGGGTSTGGCITDDEKLMLRFRGFEANDTGKECICCYQVANITVNFMCEERREKAAREAQAANQLEQQSDPENSGASGGPVTSVGGLEVDVPHVMCVDCFRLFVESRVSDRKLVTSREFDSYTVGCPMGCADSFIDPACFKEIMGAAFMVKYRRFSAIHLASHMRIVWCPACHCGVVPSAAAAAATRRPSVVAAPEVQLPGQGSSSFLWGLWGGGGARAAEAEQGEVPPRRRPSLCIGCPGCQQSLCMSCRALHAPGVDCTAAAVAAEVANTADANDGGWGVAEQDGGDEAGGGGGGAGDGSGATRRALEGSQEARFEEEPPTTSTKRCPKCHVPIFKDGGCNHMQCSMCQHEFCWLHLTEWVVGGECQRGHWSSNPALNHAYNAQRVARERQNCTVS